MISAQYMICGICRKIFHYLFLFVSILVRKILRFRHGVRGKKVPPITDPILKMSALELASKIRNRELKCVDVMRAFMTRIEEINPLVNCVVENRFDEALDDAERADEDLDSGKYSLETLVNEKPFFGVPISTKENINVEALLISAGLRMRKYHRAYRDSEVIRLMREAGAIPFALTNVPELCMWWECCNPNYGRCSNPYNTNRTSGGSSGGEAVIQSTGASPFGLGSEFAGSIRLPSFFNGIFGHKPSRNIVSVDGCFPPPISGQQASMFTIGPMSRFACDLKPVLKILADNTMNRLRLYDPVDVRNLRYFYQMDNSGEKFITPVEDDQKNAMAKVISHFEVYASHKPVKTELALLKESFNIFIVDFIDDRGVPFQFQLKNGDFHISPWTELLRWIFRRSDHTIFTIFLVLSNKLNPTYGSRKHSLLVEKGTQLRTQIQDLLGDDGVFIYPTHPSCALYHYESLFRPYNMSYTAIFNALGFPVTTVPLGLGAKEGLPTGVQIVANINEDRLCLAVAEHLEQVFGGWVEPGAENVI